MDDVDMRGVRELDEIELARMAGGGLWSALQKAVVDLSAAFGAFVGYMGCDGPCAAGGGLGAGAAAQNMLNNPGNIPRVLAM